MFDLLLVLATASMQDTPAPTAEAETTTLQATEAMTPGYWVTTAQSTDVRSGASTSNYPFLRVPAGTPFTVIGDAYGFAKVSATGPAFANATGWLRIAPNATDRFTLSEDGNAGTLQGRAEVLAPNIDSTDFADAFRWVCILDDGARVHVMEDMNLGNGARAWKIRLPGSAEGWIAREQLRPATADEIKAWSTPVFPASLTGTPTSPLADWNTWAASRVAWAADTRQQAAHTAAVTQALEQLATEEAAQIAAAEQAQIEAAAAEAAALAAKQNYVNERLASLEALVAATAIEKLDSRTASRLVEAYQQVATEEAELHPALAHLAGFRARQIRLAADLSADRARLGSLQAQVRQSNTDLETEASSLNTVTDYVIQGRLAISLIFDGQNRPIMYRIEDPLSGRSLGYLEPSASLDLSSLLGQRIGVVGRMQFDSEWNVSVVQPDRVDLVSVNP